ncbi:MAG: sensor histidine kinase [Candidatus Saccharimonadales bacterium]
MSQSFGEAYVNQVTQTQIEQAGNQLDSGSDASTAETATIAGDITLHQLREVLLVLNATLLLLVPLMAWLLTGRSLRPVQRAYQQQSDFVSDASHELRTPLTIMQAELDLALKKKRNNQEYKSALDSTRAETLRLKRLVDDLLILARGDEAVKKPITMEQVALNNTLLAAVKRLHQYAKRRDVVIELEEMAAPIIVAGSQQMLERLFDNILTNAVKYSHPGGKVAVRTAVNKDQVRVYVIDQGRGMSPAAVRRAFDRFYREDESRSDGGTGLGLSISKAIVDEHQGSISIESEVGHGTTVTITLALALNA